MKKSLVVVLLLIGTLAFGDVVLDKKDFEGDDKGPGTYIYPENKVFEEGAFDLLSLKIEEESKVYKITFTVPINFKNDWRNVNGWDVQMFDLYLNLGKGEYHHTVSGRNLYIPEGWDKVLVVAPGEYKRIWSTELMGKNKFVSDDLKAGEDIREGILVPDSYMIKGNKLEVSIKKDKLKSLDKLKSIQVFLMGAEGFPRRQDSYNRIVNELPGEWRFGGGSDYYGDTNVIDILGDNSKLGEYKSTEEETVFASVEMIKVK